VPAESTLPPRIASPHGPRRPAGADGDGAGPPRRRPPGPSTRPALIVMGVALVVLLGGGIGAVLTHGATSTAPTRTGPRTVAGAGITAVSATTALRAIEVSGQPPGDIVAALVLPKGATVQAGSAENDGIGLYDRSLSFAVPVVQSKVIEFFRAELRGYRWQLVSQGPAGDDPGYRIVGQHPSGDGYEWETGVTVEPTTFGAGTVAAGTSTAFTLRIFAVTDED